MSSLRFSEELEEALTGWLDRVLVAEHAEQLIPDHDPLRLWWSPEPLDGAIGRLVKVLVGGQEHLTLLAMIALARQADIVPDEIDRGLAAELPLLAAGLRSTSTRKLDSRSDELFASYAHEDTDRVSEILSILKELGVSTYRDVERIRPGESIANQLATLIAETKGAVLFVSQHSLNSEWVNREIDHLLARQRSSQLVVFPVLLDDVPLPSKIRDIFTIDLRGYHGADDAELAAHLLAPLARTVLETLQTSP